MPVSGDTQTLPKRHRSVYKSFYGSIPKEPNGRTYEIHHIDGDHSNNHPTNLKAVTIQEHYDIHWRQGDYAACMYMSLRMNMTTEEISNLARLRELEKVKNGTHIFLNGEIARKMNLDRSKKGEHPFQGGDITRRNNKKRLEDRTHNLLGPRTPEWCEWNKQMQTKRIKERTHNFLGITNQKISYMCSRCGKTGKGPRFKNAHIINKCK